jgi:hypothetical protein
MDFTVGDRAVSGGLALACLVQMMYYFWVAARSRRFGPVEGGRIMLASGLGIFFGFPVMLPQLPEAALNQVDLVGFATFALGTLISAWGTRQRAQAQLEDPHQG